MVATGDVSVTLDYSDGACEVVLFVVESKLVMGKNHGHTIYTRNLVNSDWNQWSKNLVTISDWISNQKLFLWFSDWIFCYKK